jgi:hypothetical protein
MMVASHRRGPPAFRCQDVARRQILWISEIVLFTLRSRSPRLAIPVRTQGVMAQRIFVFGVQRRIPDVRVSQKGCAAQINSAVASMTSILPARYCGFFHTFDARGGRRKLRNLQSKLDAPPSGESVTRFNLCLFYRIARAG